MLGHDGLLKGVLVRIGILLQFGLHKTVGIGFRRRVSVLVTEGVGHVGSVVSIVAEIR